MKKLPIEIRQSKIHGIGVFATKDVAWGKEIIEYVGQILSPKEGARRVRFYDTIGVTYLFDLDGKRYIDGLVGGNISRFINHSKLNPNCCCIKKNGGVYIYSYTDIKAGEELTFDYEMDGLKP